MSETTRKRILYVALVLAIIYGLVNLPGRRRSRPSQTGTVPPALPADAITELHSATTRPDWEKFEKLPWGSDPFRVRQPQPTAPRATKKLELSGIVFNADRPLAIINNRMLGVGDQIDRATVVSIGKRSVTLTRGGNTFTLTVIDRG